VADGVPVVAFAPPPEVEADDVLLASFCPVVLEVVPDVLAPDLPEDLLDALLLLEPDDPDIESEAPEELPVAPIDPGAESPALAGRLSLALPVSLVP
jgi:hypothetical protein